MTDTFIAGAALPAAEAAAAGARTESPKLPHESRLHLHFRFRRPKQADKLARSQDPVHAKRGETRALFTHVGGKTTQRKRFVVLQSAVPAEEVTYGRVEWEVVV